MILKKPKLLIVGSLNMDLMVFGVPKIPEYGESLKCTDYQYCNGGKGANQAIAAAMQGADVTMVGRVGDDTNGRILKRSLRKHGVDVRWIYHDKVEKTGLAQMMVGEQGKYVSYLVMGANAKLDAQDVELALNAKDYDMLVMQLEMPLETVYKTYELARKKGIRVFLDAGPAMQMRLEPLKGIYILSPNEVETKALTGIEIDTFEKATEAALFLYRMVEPTFVILKMGKRGVLCYDGSKVRRVPAFDIPVIDTTAAGDTFGGALAVQLARGVDIETALQYASVAAALCVSRKGSQDSIPSEAEVIDCIRQFERN